MWTKRQKRATGTVANRQTGQKMASRQTHVK